MTNQRCISYLNNFILTVKNHDDEIVQMVIFKTKIIEVKLFILQCRSLIHMDELFRTVHHLLFFFVFLHS